jgi:hypothetical protein
MVTSYMKQELFFFFFFFAFLVFFRPVSFAYRFLELWFTLCLFLMARPFGFL